MVLAGFRVAKQEVVHLFHDRGLAKVDLALIELIIVATHQLLSVGLILELLEAVHDAALLVRAVIVFVSAVENLEVFAVVVFALHVAIFFFIDELREVFGTGVSPIVHLHAPLHAALLLVHLDKLCLSLRAIVFAESREIDVMIIRSAALEIGLFASKAVV